MAWGFCGRSYTDGQRKDDAGHITSYHCRWEHYADSQTDEPGVDEADMFLQDNGTILEKGVISDPDTDAGMTQNYEELWQDLEIEAFGTKGKRSSVVVRTKGPVEIASGMVVKIGGYCQGILKRDGQTTVERWQHKTTQQDDIQELALHAEESTRTRNDVSHRRAFIEVHCYSSHVPAADMYGECP